MKAKTISFLSTRLLSFLLAMGMYSCSSEETPDCLEVEIIGSEDCIDHLIGVVKNRENFGVEILYYDGVKYDNAVKIVARESYSAGTKVYINYREYNRDTDYNIFGRTLKICPAVVGFYNVPTFVAIKASTDRCP